MKALWQRLTEAQRAELLRCAATDRISAGNARPGDHDLEADVDELAYLGLASAGLISREWREPLVTELGLAVLAWAEKYSSDLAPVVERGVGSEVSTE